MQQDNAGSAPMLGSVAVAWAVMANGRFVEACDTQDRAMIAVSLREQQMAMIEGVSCEPDGTPVDHEVVPLYRSPPLSDTERDTIIVAAEQSEKAARDARKTHGPTAEIILQHASVLRGIVNSSRVADRPAQEAVAWRAYSSDGGEAVYLLYEQARAAADEWNWSVEPLFSKQQTALWIPVAEKLPAEGVMVLGWDKSDGVVLTINAGVSRSGHRIWFGCSPDAGEYEDAKRHSDPTHWQPLPAPPTDGK
jgi:hypothetical protein